MTGRTLPRDAASLLSCGVPNSGKAVGILPDRYVWTIQDLIFYQYAKIIAKQAPAKK